MKLKPGLGASNAIRQGNGVGLFYSSRTHMGLMKHDALNLHWRYNSQKKLIRGNKKCCKQEMTKDYYYRHNDCSTVIMCNHHTFVELFHDHCP